MLFSFLIVTPDDLAGLFCHLYARLWVCQVAVDAFVDGSAKVRIVEEINVQILCFIIAFG